MDLNNITISMDLETNDLYLIHYDKISSNGKMEGVRERKLTLEEIFYFNYITGEYLKRHNIENPIHNDVKLLKGGIKDDL